MKLNYFLSILALSFAANLLSENPKPSCPEGYNFSIASCVKSTGSGRFDKIYMLPICPNGYEIRMSMDEENPGYRKAECIKK